MVCTTAKSVLFPIYNAASRGKMIPYTERMERMVRNQKRSHNIDTWFDNKTETQRVLSGSENQN